MKVLGQAFDGTKQVGSKIPIVYDEYGIQSTIPKNKARKYTGREPGLDEARLPGRAGSALQARRSASRSASRPCKAMFLYHAFDEVGTRQWQSGLYYVDHTRESRASRSSGRRSRKCQRGVIARCPGMRLKVNCQGRLPRRCSGTAVSAVRIQFQLSCNLDCQYTSGVIDLSSGKSILARLGKAIGGKTKTVKLPARPLQKGSYRVVVSLVAAVNPGPREPQGERAVRGSVTLHRGCMPCPLTFGSHAAVYMSAWRGESGR